MSGKFEIKKKNLMMAAWDLFSLKGYDGTSVTEIIEKMKIAKGTFYHYFESKESILNYAIDLMLKKQVEVLKDKMDSDEIGAVGKLYFFLDQFKSWKIKNNIFMKKLVKTLYSEKNLLLRYRLFDQGLKILGPMLGDILKQGMDEKVFDLEHPYETAIVILNLGYSINMSTTKIMINVIDNPNDEKSIDEMVKYFNIYYTSLEKIIGAEKNSLDRITKDDFLKVLG
jgi:AcrR family transcriptional regulator